MLSTLGLLFVLLQPQTPLPPGRQDGTIAFDSKRNQLWLFGGSSPSNLNDLWRYDPQANTWTELRPTGTLPAARLGHVFVYDAQRDQLVVFGGQARGFFSDVWAYSPANNSWRQLAGDNAGPSNRYGHSGVYDAKRNRLIISHGFTSAGRFDDTWAFDLGTNRWTNLRPAGPLPLKRCLHHAVLDAAGDKMYLYGGCASGFGPCPLADLWELDLASNRWKLLADTDGGLAPKGREHYGITFDSARKRVILFGGTGNGTFGDTWEFDPSIAKWSRIDVAGPSARYRVQGEYAEALQTSFFFGGNSNTGYSNELWALRAPGVPAVSTLKLDAVTDVFAFAAGAVAPNQWISLFGSGLAGAALSLDGAPLSAAFQNDTQINVLLPATLRAPGSVELKLTRGQESLSRRLDVASARPTLFPDANPVAMAGIGVFFGTGSGSFANGEVRINGRAVETLYSGPAPGIPGLFQVNFRTGEPGDHQLSVVFGGVESPSVPLRVR
jgi:uncharacterized protein (TIGR03437 family)